MSELGLTVRLGALVPVAARDLEVAVEAADHQHLFELLRTLYQRVELARRPRRHHKLLGALPTNDSIRCKIERGVRHRERNR